VLLFGSVMSMKVVEVFSRSENRTRIWGPDSEPRIEDAHRLVLQLIASGILSFEVKNPSVKGDYPSAIELNWGVVQSADWQGKRLSITEDAYWAGIRHF